MSLCTITIYYHYHRLDYGSQLWSLYKAKDIRLLESVQRAFTKHIQGMHTYSYAVDKHCCSYML